jgi:hypothetical protein
VRCTGEGKSPRKCENRERMRQAQTRRKIIVIRETERIDKTMDTDEGPFHIHTETRIHTQRDRKSDTERP